MADLRTRPDVEDAITQFVAMGARREEIILLPDCDRPNDTPALQAIIDGVLMERLPSGAVVRA